MSFDTPCTEDIKEVKPAQDNVKYFVENNESSLVKVTGFIINILTHIFIALVLFLCIWFSCLPHVDYITQLHIIFCVLGYQFFMIQGTLVFSKNNSWTMPLNFRQKKWIHWFFQLLGISLATLGSGLIMKEKRVYNDPHFNTAHGILGLFALLMSFLSLINGTMSLHLYKLRKYVNGRWLKVSHRVAGIVTMLLAVVSLCFGYDKEFFRAWAQNELVLFLIVITMLSTLLVVVDRMVASLWKPVTSL